MDPEIDCCVYGPYGLYKRYCNNPSPEGNGQLCTTTNGSLAVIDSEWRTCVCKFVVALMFMISSRNGKQLQVLVSHHVNLRHNFAPTTLVDQHSVNATTVWYQGMTLTRI